MSRPQEAKKLRSRGELGRSLNIRHLQTLQSQDSWHSGQTSRTTTLIQRSRRTSYVVFASCICIHQRMYRFIHSPGPPASSRRRPGGRPVRSWRDRWYVPFQVRPLHIWKGEGAIGTVPEAGIRAQYRDYIAVVDKAVQGGTRATRVSERGSQGEATHAQLFSSNA